MCISFVGAIEALLTRLSLLCTLNLLQISNLFVSMRLNVFEKPTSWLAAEKNWSKCCNKLRVGLSRKGANNFDWSRCPLHYLGCLTNHNYRHSSIYTVNVGTQKENRRSKNRVNQGYLVVLTLHRKILLCPIYWGTQWTMEISSNE